MFKDKKIITLSIIAFLLLFVVIFMIFKKQITQKSDQIEPIVEMEKYQPVDRDHANPPASIHREDLENSLKDLDL